MPGPSSVPSLTSHTRRRTPASSMSTGLRVAHRYVIAGSSSIATFRPVSGVIARQPSSRSRAPVALVDHPRAERPGLDQLQRDVLGDGWQKRRAATDDDRMAQHAQLVDEADLYRLRGQAGAADLDVLVRR